MDPRVKLVLIFAYIILVFIPQNWVGLGIAVAFLVFAVACSRLPLRLVWKSVKPIIPLIILTSALNIFYVDKGVELVHWGFFRLTTGGLTTAAFIAIRILCLDRGQLPADLYHLAHNADRRHGTAAQAAQGAPRQRP